MNSELRALVLKHELDHAGHERIKYAFCFACASRIQHLLENDEAITAYQKFDAYMKG